MRVVIWARDEPGWVKSVELGEDMTIIGYSTLRQDAMSFKDTHPFVRLAKMSPERFQIYTDRETG